jgi:positive regulator of sigma E activity
MDESPERTGRPGKARRKVKEKGIVLEVKDNIVAVEVKPHEECHKCGICGAGRPRKITVTGEGAQGLASGDKVDLEIEPAVMLKIYSLLYGIPLIVFVGMSLFLYAALHSPLISFAGALAATSLTYIATGFYTRNSPHLSPRVIKKQ